MTKTRWRSGWSRVEGSLKVEDQRKVGFGKKICIVKSIIKPFLPNPLLPHPHPPHTLSLDVKQGFRVLRYVDFSWLKIYPLKLFSGEWKKVDSSSFSIGHAVHPLIKFAFLNCNSLSWTNTSAMCPFLLKLLFLAKLFLSPLILCWFDLNIKGLSLIMGWKYSRSSSSYAQLSTSDQ